MYFSFKASTDRKRPGDCAFCLNARCINSLFLLWRPRALPALFLSGDAFTFFYFQYRFQEIHMITVCNNSRLSYLMHVLLASVKDHDGQAIGRASLVLILRDVTRSTPLLARLVQLELSLAFNPMLSLWEILSCYK